MKYYILTVQEVGNFSTRTVAYQGNLVKYLLEERKQGRKTNILFKEEISKYDYTYYVSEKQINPNLF